MKYELAKKLKDAGFPEITRVALELNLFRYRNINDPEVVTFPYIQELIEEVMKFNELDFGLVREEDTWTSFRGFFNGQWTSWGSGKTPEEAVANLWLELNGKPL